MNGKRDAYVPEISSLLNYDRVITLLSQ